MLQIIDWWDERLSIISIFKGGYVHLGLADLTGFVPRLIGLKQGYMGYNVNYSDDELWGILER